METTEFEVAALAAEIDGCIECIERLAEAIQTAAGVTDAHVCDAGTLSVTYDPGMVSVHEIQRKAQAMGVRIAALDLEEVTYSVEELDCSDCAVHVEQHLRGLAGVHAVNANFAAQVVDVTFHPATIPPEQLRTEIARVAGHCRSATDREVSFDIEGMDCASCARGIGAALEEMAGVGEAAVNYATAKAKVVFSPEIVEADEIVERVRELGYEVRRTDVAQESFVVSGIDCPSCAREIEEVLTEAEGIAFATLVPATARLSVGYDRRRTGTERIVAAVEALGYGISAARKEPSRRRWHEGAVRRPRTVLTLLCALFTLVGLILAWTGASERLSIAALALAIALGGYHIARSAWLSLRTSLAADMNVLMTVAVTGAMLIGEWHEAAAVVLLFSIANALEAYTSERTRNAIRALMDLSPQRATLLRDGEELSVTAESVRIGDELLVRPGERIAVDGTVVAGGSEIDQAPVTGESLPVEVQPGSDVFAGTVNGPGLLTVRATRIAEDSTIARIIHMVEEAQAQQSPSQRFVDRFARYYTPAVIALAALTALIPPFALGAEFGPWFYRALTLLVLACPCALVISTPVAIAAAIANGARNGVLIKGGMYVERLAGVRQFALDKTGTLTEGRPQVTDLLPVAGCDEEELLRIAAIAESGSEHALGRAIVRHAEERGVVWDRPEQVRAITGMGVQAQLAESLVFVGRPGWIGELGVDVGEVESATAKLQEQARTIVLVALAEHSGGEPRLLGAIGIADRARDEAASAVRALRSEGAERLVMLTGDAEAVAATVAAELSIAEHASELLPDEKLDRVREMRARGAVAMVGDGVNDAPALALADVGIAMGAAGTDVALETADVALMSDDLSKLAYAVRLSRMALRIVKQNIVAALVLKLAFMALVVPGMLTLWLAILGDTGVSIAVTLNSMRLLRLRARD